MLNVKLLLAFAVFGFLDAKVIPGRCPKVSTMLDFDPIPYLGDWYQQGGNPTWYQPASTGCVKAVYGDNGDGTVSIHNYGANSDEEHGWQSGEVCGYAETTDVGGVLKVYFPFIPVAADYEVLETDYESYACVYSCAADVLVAHTEIGYILTREQEYNQELVDKCLNLFEAQGLTSMIEGFVTFYSGADCSYEVETPDPSCQ